MERIGTLENLLYLDVPAKDSFVDSPIEFLLEHIKVLVRWHDDAVEASIRLRQ